MIRIPTWKLTQLTWMMKWMMKLMMASMVTSMATPGGNVLCLDNDVECDFDNDLLAEVDDGVDSNVDKMSLNKQNAQTFHLIGENSEQSAIK